MIKVLILSIFGLMASESFAAQIPKFSFPLLNGETYNAVYNMADFPHAVFVFEAYRSSCGACTDNAANIKKLAKTYEANKKVQILDLSLDQTQDEFNDWISRIEPNHPVVQDVDFKAFKAMRKQGGVPQVFVVDCRGNLLGNLSGVWDEGEYKKVERLVEVGLNVECPESR